MTPFFAAVRFNSFRKQFSRARSNEFRNAKIPSTLPTCSTFSRTIKLAEAIEFKVESASSKSSSFPSEKQSRFAFQFISNQDESREKLREQWFFCSCSFAIYVRINSRASCQDHNRHLYERFLGVMSSAKKRRYFAGLERGWPNHWFVSCRKKAQTRFKLTRRDSLSLLRLWALFRPSTMRGKVSRLRNFEK